MADDFTIYSGLLKPGQCISKTDFIYRVKLHCDCTEERHGKFLRMLYNLHFSLVRKDASGKILVHY